MDNLHSWLLEKKQKEMILDSLKTKEAVNYCSNRWEDLENFIKYPESTFSTNAALIETAKQNGTCSRCEHCNNYLNGKCIVNKNIEDYKWLPLNQNKPCDRFNFDEKKWKY